MFSKIEDFRELEQTRNRLYQSRRLSQAQDHLIKLLLDLYDFNMAHGLGIRWDRFVNLEDVPKFGAPPENSFGKVMVSWDDKKVLCVLALEAKRPVTTLHDRNPGEDLEGLGLYSQLLGVFKDIPENTQESVRVATKYLDPRSPNTPGEYVSICLEGEEGVTSLFFDNDGDLCRISLK